MEGARGFRKDMVRSADWRKQMSRDTDQEQDKQEKQCESSESIRHTNHAKRDQDHAGRVR